MLQGTFTFLLYPRTAVAWVLMSLGLLIGTLLVALEVWLVDHGVGVGGYALMLPTCLLTLFGWCYASACFTGVIEQTANGVDAIIDWPSGLWREWLWSLGWSAGSYFVALACGAVAALPFPWPWGGLVMVHVAWLLYPVFLLSSLENNHMLAILSLTVLRSLAVVPVPWLVVYGVSWVMMIGWFAALVPLGDFPLFTILYAVPLLAAMLLTYARFLGRLSWCIGDRMGDE